MDRLHKIKSHPGWLLPAGACILILILLGGCMGNYGSYNRDAEVFDAFNKQRVPADYRYYYYHSGSEPIAVIGVEKKYDAGSRMWREVDPDSEAFRDLIHWMWADLGYESFAARINDPSGQQVGIMFTSVREVTIKFAGDNRIVVMLHTPFLWGPAAESGETDIGSRVTSALPSERQRASNPKGLNFSVSYLISSTKTP
jgi:hypothetical protein